MLTHLQELKSSPGPQITTVPIVQGLVRFEQLWVASLVQGWPSHPAAARVAARTAKRRVFFMVLSFLAKQSKSGGLCLRC